MDDGPLDLISTLRAIKQRESEAAGIWLRFCDAVSSGHPPPTRAEVLTLRNATYRATQLHGEAMDYMTRLEAEAATASPDTGAER